MNCRTERDKECPTPTHCCAIRVSPRRAKRRTTRTSPSACTWRCGRISTARGRRLTKTTASSSLPACRSPRRRPNPDVRAPRRHDSRPIRTRRCEPPATPSRTARRCPAWTSNSKASRIRTCSGWASGRFAVAATRTARGGGADGSERSAFLLATSRDLTSYDQRGLVLLGPTSGVHRPTVIYNDAERRYVIRWHDDDGHAMRAVCADIIAAVGTTLPAEPDDTSEPIAASNANDVNATSVRRDYGIADAVPGNEIDITEQEAATLIARFGRVYNTGVTVPSMTVSADLYDGEARDLIGSLGRTTAKLQYSDGSTAMRARRLGRRTARRPRRRRRSWQAQAGRTPYGPRSHPSDRLSRAVRRRTRRSVRVRMELQR